MGCSHPQDLILDSAGAPNAKPTVGLDELRPLNDIPVAGWEVNYLSRTDGDYYMSSLPHPRQSISSARNAQPPQAELNVRNSRPLCASEIGSAKREGHFGTS